MPSAKTRLLLAEDDPAMVELLRFTFEKEGFEVVGTPSGEEALLLASELNPDIVILDWMLEELSGIEVCRRLRRSVESANLPIIMLTARGEEADRVRGLETGADDYVTKPFSPPELIARVRAVLRRVRPALAGMVLSVGDLELESGARVWLRLPGLESVPARVAWSQYGRAGLTFDHPYHPAVVERIVSRQG